MSEKRKAVKELRSLKEAAEACAMYEDVLGVEVGCEDFADRIQNALNKWDDE